MKVAIIANRDKDKDLIVSNRLCRAFESRGAEAFICHQEALGERYHFTNPGKISKDISLLVTVGGDGTLIEAARDLGSLNVPIIGVNMGMLGFLAEVEAASVDDAVDKICRGIYTVEKHMMLHVDIVRNGKVIAHDRALNDAVISKIGHTHLIHFEVSVNGAFLTELHADGMIVSTPTGSTAYNLSAGGPIVDPGASMFVMTPICAHSFTSRSVVLGDDSIISITVKNKVGASDRFDKYCAVSFDGTGSISLEPGDVIDIRKSSYVTQLVKLNDTSFYETLRRKMNTV
ncbi:MAG: NAD(+)/NADH kinase [Lachnospiraceae bacterium]|nr:NAD(+)/NADH kinase [Lachnospiraceae bacterium]